MKQCCQNSEASGFNFGAFQFSFSNSTKDVKYCPQLIKSLTKASAGEYIDWGAWKIFHFFVGAASTRGGVPPRQIINAATSLEHKCFLGMEAASQLNKFSPSIFLKCHLLELLLQTSHWKVQSNESGFK